MNLDTGLQPEDFQDRTKIVEEYLPKLAEAVKASLGAERIQIYDFIVHPSFSFLSFDPSVMYP